MNIVYALIGTYLTSAFVSFLYFNVKRQEIVKEKLINTEKYQLIGSLAASISYEIRNPLTTSRGFLQMLNRRPTNAEEVKRFASLALEGIDQANTIITDYLNFAKPHVNKMEQIELKSEITSIIPFINSLAHFSNVDNEPPLPTLCLRGRSFLLLLTVTFYKTVGLLLSFTTHVAETFAASYRKQDFCKWVGTHHLLLPALGYP